jgi:hypothetical protein
MEVSLVMTEHLLQDQITVVAVAQEVLEVAQMEEAELLTQ